MEDEYIDVAKLIEGNTLPFLEYVKVSKMVEYFDKTKWSSESVSYYHVLVCRVIDMYKYVKGWDIEKKISFCAYLRNVYNLEHRAIRQFAEWVIDHYNDIFGLNLSEVVTMFTIHCMIKYKCEYEDVVRFEKIYKR